MKITDHLSRSRLGVSFEFFPPRDQAGTDELLRTIRELVEKKPVYVSVTYGAGGSTRRLTIDLVKRIKAETGIETMAHLTCVGSTRDEIAGILDQLAEAGIENILPLRGDPPRGQAEFVPVEAGFSHASELIAFVRERHPEFCIAVAGYPEKHPESPDFASDLRHLGDKIEAGGDFIVTQLFFDARDFLGFVERARELGIGVPIVPGIMPITNVSQIKRFTAMCGAHVPARLLARLEAVQHEPERVREIGVAHAIEQCRELEAAGVPLLHFYTLNRSTASLSVIRGLKTASCRS